MSLPHRYPFRWLDTPSDGGAPGSGAPGTGAPGTEMQRHRVRLSGTAHMPRRGPLSPIIALEILAQAAASTAPSRVDAPPSPALRAAAGEGPGMLAAIDDATFADGLVDRPLLAGDELDVEVEQTAAFGKLLRVQGRIYRCGTLLISARLVLATSS